MQSLYQQFFRMTIGNWLLPRMKKAQGLHFPSKQFERDYDRRIGHLGFLVFCGVLFLIIAKPLFVVMVAVLVVYALYLWRWCRHHRITTARQRNKRKKG